MKIFKYQLEIKLTFKKILTIFFGFWMCDIFMVFSVQMTLMLLVANMANTK